jgi:L-ascorbate metabolism protein UlaG (beta-lactamase superfamily)
MRIVWYGHACFRLETEELSVVTDPYTPENAGLERVTDETDVVVMSSALDQAHSYSEMFPSARLIVNAMDAVKSPRSIAPGVEIWAVAASEGPDRPDEAKPNAMYGMTLDRVRLCHMGDIGTPMTARQLDALRGRSDVLFALAGGNQTIGLDDLMAAVAFIEPRLIVPMHYWTPSIRYGVGPIEDLLRRWSGPVIEVNDPSFEVSINSLPLQATILTLEAKCDPLLRAGKVSAARGLM